MLFSYKNIFFKYISHQHMEEEYLKLINHFIIQNKVMYLKTPF